MGNYGLKIFFMMSIFFSMGSAFADTLSIFIIGKIPEFQDSPWVYIADNQISKKAIHTKTIDLDKSSILKQYFPWKIRHAEILWSSASGYQHQNACKIIRNDAEESHLLLKISWDENSSKLTCDGFETAP